MTRSEHHGAEAFVRALTEVEVRARRVARRLSLADSDGDDLFQEAAIQAFEKFGDLRDPSRFASWFFAILFRAHRSRARRAALRRWVSLEVLFGGDEPPSPFTVGADEALAGAERFRKALAVLSPKAREAIVAFELEGLTLEEMSTMTGESVGTLKTRLSRARERLREHYVQTDESIRQDQERLAPGSSR